MRDRRFDGELFAIGTDAAQSTHRAHAPRRDSHLAKVLDVIATLVPEAHGNESVKRTAERLHSGAAKHALSGWVEKHDALLRIYRDNRIQGRVYKAGHVRLTLACGFQEPRIIEGQRRQFCQILQQLFLFGSEMVWSAVTRDQPAKRLVSGLQRRDCQITNPLSRVHGKFISRQLVPHSDAFENEN